MCDDQESALTGPDCQTTQGRQRGAARCKIGLMKKLRARVSGLIYAPLVILILLGEFVDLAARCLDWAFHTQLRKPKITVEEVERLVETNLPLGSSVPEIRAFMDHHKIRHFNEVHTVIGFRDTDWENPKIAGKKDIIKKTIVGWIENIGRYLWSRMIYASYSIWMTRRGWSSIRSMCSAQVSERTALFISRLMNAFL